MSKKTGALIKTVGLYVFLVLCCMLLQIYGRGKWDTTVNFVTQLISNGK
jgi:hypothetical protein